MVGCRCRQESITQISHTIKWYVFKYKYIMCDWVKILFLCKLKANV